MIFRSDLVMKSIKIKVGRSKIDIPILKMKGRYMFSPWFLVCPYNDPKTFAPCRKGVNLADDRECCLCKFYNGPKILGLEWQDGKQPPYTFVVYPVYGYQYNLKEIKELIKEGKIEKFFTEMTKATTVQKKYEAVNKYFKKYLLKKRTR